jgi:hypothetical protein
MSSTSPERRKFSGYPSSRLPQPKMSCGGPTFPELVAVLDTKRYPIIDRMTMNAWDDPDFRKALEATGRTHLLLAGVTLQVCAATPAYAALAAGYKSYVVVDASGVLSATNRQVGIARIQQAGVIPVDYFSIVCEIMATNADRSANEVYPALDVDFDTVVGQFSRRIGGTLKWRSNSNGSTSGQGLLGQLISRPST